MSEGVKDAFLQQLWSKPAVVEQLLLSLVTSLIVAVMAASHKNGGLSTPYHNIIFGLSTFDILHMIGLIYGPFYTIVRFNSMRYWQ